MYVVPLFAIVNLDVVLSTHIQNGHDYNAFQLPKSIAQCELSDMPHYHENDISTFLMLCHLVGFKGSLC
jgi:hypothetical protein